MANLNFRQDIEDAYGRMIQLPPSPTGQTYYSTTNNQQPNRFGDVGGEMGNENLAAAAYLLANAGGVTSQYLPDYLPQPVANALAYVPDVALAGLIGGIGGLEKGIGYGAELIGGDTSSERRLARDLTSMATEYMAPEMLATAPVLDAGFRAAGSGVMDAAAGVARNTRGLTSDAMYAGRSLLEGDLGGVRDAFTSSRAPRGLSADAPKIEVLGSGYGQIDQRLTIPNVEGYVDFSTFDGKPAINMIEVPETARRQGSATRLLEALQSQFPDTEIDWGSLTDEGSKLYSATQFSDIPSEYADDFARLSSLQRLRDEKLAQYDAIEASGAPYPNNFFDDWNAVQDEIDSLSSALEFKSPTKRLISQPANRRLGLLFGGY